MGSPLGSRVLEYDPQTQAFPRWYPGGKGKRIYTDQLGMRQGLANGNTLISDTDGGQVFEVTRDQEVVWSCSCGHEELHRGRRYLAQEVPFLKGDKHARP